MQPLMQAPSWSRRQAMKAASPGISAPANCNNVIAVTAHAINGENATYSNIDAPGGTQVTISAPGGGSPGSLGSSPGAPSGIDDPAWDGYYIWSTDL